MNSGNFKKFAVEFLIASLVCSVFLLWAFHEPILSRRPASFSINPPAAQVIKFSHEHHYQNLSMHYVKTKLIRQGIFPNWAPDSHGGTPLIGKMQTAVFAPYNLLLYIAPMDWMPWMFMLSVALKFYLAFCFVYLFSRILGNGLLGSIFAGIFFITVQTFVGYANYDITGAILSLPLLLLLVELYFRRHRRFALFFLPWAAALPFFCGHFETAFRSNLITIIYFICRLWMPQLWGNPASGLQGSFTNRERVKHILSLTAALALGMAIAGFQIYAGWEYVQYSYNRVWRTLPEYGISYNVICKHLSMEDIPLLTAGILFLTAFWLSLRRGLRAEKNISRELGWKLAACVFLAFAIACLANVGLDTSLVNLFLYGQNCALWTRLVNLFILFLAFWGWSRKDSGPGLKILGYIAIANVLISLKVAPFTNILVNTPPFDNFTIVLYNNDFYLALAVLSASSIQACSALRLKPMADRWKTALGALSVLCIFLFGYIGARPMSGFIARHIPSGLCLAEQGPLKSEPMGGITGPYARNTYDRNTLITGWLPASEPVADVSVSVVRSNQVITTVNAKTDIGRSARRFYFYADVPLPPENGQVMIFAQVRYTDGTTRTLRGPKITLLGNGKDKKPWNKNALMFVICAFPFVFLWAPIIRPLFVLLLVFCGSLASFPAVASDQGPLQLPGMVQLKQDKTLFRISSLSPGFGFLRANYANLYDIADIRIGSDNLDVLTMVHFLNLSNTFLYSQDPALRETGFRLMGLANVKYFVDTASASPDHPALKLHYRSPYMSIFQNKYTLPRALFFHDYVHIPLYLRDWRDWKSRGKALAPLTNWLRKDRPTLKNLLPLHDLPSSVYKDSGETPASQGSGPSTVKITEYLPARVVIDVDAARPGFVFLSDNYFPGWKAFVNGKKTKILRSWITFRSVHVPAGKSKVVFLYRPFLLLAGLLLSACMIVSWLILYLRGRLSAGPGMMLDRWGQDTPLSKPEKHAKQSKSAKSQKTQALKFEAAEAEGLAHSCARILEPFFLIPIVLVFLFWIIWSGFVYKGLAVNAAAWLIGAGMLFAVLRFYHSYRKASTGSSFEA